MTSHPGIRQAEVFVSYASRDRDRVVALARHLEAAGITLWRDQSEILGGENYGPKIVEGIRNCKVLMLMCSSASLRSKNVKQEIQMAWSFDRPYLPLLIEPLTQYPEQVQYWLEGSQWIEVLDRPTEQWLPRVLQALARAGVGPGMAKAGSPSPGETSVQPQHQGLAGLMALARFTDQIWPVPANRGNRDIGCLRDLGAPQDDVVHGYRLGSRVSLALESDREGHLLLLDVGTSGTIYCLCPSAFAPDTRLPRGRSYLPQAGARYDAFEVSGRPGREHLLAILSDEPLGLDWMPRDPRTPARVLTPADIGELLVRLRKLGADRWTALATYFEVIA
jgi:hypothetical protein